MLTGQSERPVCTILGDPNGADKSSVFAALDFPGRFVNADVIAHRINTASPESVSVTAGKHVLRELDELIVGRESIAYETTLSSHQSIALMQRAIEARYQVNLVFVALRDANLHVKRVAQRVEEDGHDIPEAIIRRRYESSMMRLVAAGAAFPSRHPSADCVGRSRSVRALPRLVIDQPSHATQCQQIALRAEPRDHAIGSSRNE